MDDLPLELYGAIFDHLHLTDLARLRRVSKKFRFLVQEYRIVELLCCVPVIAIDNQKEYQNSIIIKRKNKKNFVHYVISRYPYVGGKEFHTAPIFLKSGQFNVQFLKSLSFVYTFEDGAVRFTDINKLVKLERLEIAFSRAGPSSGDDKLCLPNLRTFLLLRTFHDFDLEVDAPRCEGFHFENHPNDYAIENWPRQIIRLKFKHPDSVKYLSLYRYHKRSHVFRNVEYLQISSTSLKRSGGICSPGLIDEELFVAFPRLKTLKIMNYGSLEGLKRLFRRKNLLGGRNCEMFFHGIRLVDGKELEVFEESDLEEKGFHNYMDPHLLAYPHFSTPAHFSAQLHNYDKLEEGLNFVTKIEDLTVRDLEMVGKFFEADSQRFLRIFDSVTTVSSGIQIERPDLFVRFLTSLRLIELKILNSGMPQEYFVRLGIKTLKRLEVEEEKKINLSFTNNIPELRMLETNHVVTIEKEVKLNERNNLCIRAKIGKWLIIVSKKTYCGTEPRYDIAKRLVTDTTDRYIKDETSYEVAVTWFEEELRKEERVFLNKKNEASRKAKCFNM